MVVLHVGKSILSHGITHMKWVLSAPYWARVPIYRWYKDKCTTKSLNNGYCVYIYMYVSQCYRNMVALIGHQMATDKRLHGYRISPPTHHTICIGSCGFNKLPLHNSMSLSLASLVHVATCIICILCTCTCIINYVYVTLTQLLVQRLSA